MQSIFGPKKDRRVPLRSVQTVRIRVKPYKHLAQIGHGNILNIRNEMQFSQKEPLGAFFKPYQFVKPYGS